MHEPARPSAPPQHVIAKAQETNVVNKIKMAGPENEAIRELKSKLVAAVKKSLQKIVGEAHTRKLITDDQRDEILELEDRTKQQKAEKFMGFIIETVEDSTAFEDFCQLLCLPGCIGPQNKLAQQLKELMETKRKLAEAARKKGPRVKEDSPGDDSDGDGKPEDENLKEEGDDKCKEISNDDKCSAVPDGVTLHGAVLKHSDSGYCSSMSNTQQSSSQSTSGSIDTSSLVASRNDYPRLDPKSLNEDETRDLEGSLMRNAKKIVLKFGQLDDDTCQSLQKRSISPKDLASCVLGLSAFPAGVGTKPLLDEHKAELKTATSVIDIFFLIRDYYSYYNYTILEYIIERRGSESDKENLKEYRTEFKNFCQTSVYKVVEYGSEKDVENRAKLVVKLSENSGISLVGDVSLVQYKFATILGLKPSGLYLRTVKEGCVELLFLVPKFITKKVFRSAFSEEQEAELREMSIVKVECNQPPFVWPLPVQRRKSKPIPFSKSQAGEHTPKTATKDESPIHSEDSENDELSDGSSSSSIDSSSESQYSDSESDEEFESTSEMEHSPSSSLEPKYQIGSSSRKRKLPADLDPVQELTKKIKCESESEDKPLSPGPSGIDIKPEGMAAVAKTFSLWKRKYLFYKDGETQATRQVDEIICKMFSEEEFIFGFARCIPKYFEKVEQKHIVLNTLDKQPQFLIAKRIMGKSAEEDLCGAVSLMVIGSRHVSEVHSLISGLMTSLHPDSRPEVTELFYCLATLFFALWNMGILPQRFHYYVFFSMSILESGSYSDYASFEDLQTAVGTTMPSASVSPPSRVPSQKQFTTPSAVASSSGSKPPSKRPRVSIGPRPTHKMSQRRGKNPTTEQLRILKHPLKREETVRISALAGTGKTTTLMMVAQKNLLWKFLYCAFNKSAKRHAETKFPQNVHVTTMHGLAHRKLHVRTKFSGKLSRYGINALDVAGYLSQEKAPKLFGYPKRYGHAKNVLATLNAFIASDDDTIMDKHLPFLQPGAGKQELLADATDLWKKMSDPENKDVKFTHDGYLKIYQLQRPILKYDCLLIDEAQDLTPAQLSILMGQTCAKILAGDEHQQIYSFRGTTNALDTFSYSATFDLTQSFRFGPEIAYCASCVLEHLKQEQKKTIVGQLVSDRVTGEEEGQVAIIARKNSTLFDEVVHFCDHYSSKIGFVGGLRSYDLDMILDIYWLIKGKKGIDDPVISKFGNIEELDTYANKGGDSRIKGKISICREYGDRIPILIDMIKERKVKRKYAPVVFSTAHKSKGLEFDTVKLADDFFHPKYGPSTDDKKLLYVVVTRAKRRLVMSPTLVKLLHDVKEDFVYPIRPTEPEPMGASKVKCPLCDETREAAAIQFEKLPDPLILSTRDSVTGKQIRKPGGILCRQCTSKAVLFMNPLPRLKLSNVAGLCDILIGARFDVSRWKSLASQLEISDPGRIEDMYHFPIPCLEEVIHQWLRCDQAPSWGKLATAVNKVESRGQGPTLRHAMKVSQEGISGVIRKSDRPTLTQLTWFPGQRETINIVEKVASYYSDIGTSLLNDRDGSKVAAILQERQNDPIQITTAILRSWLDFYRYTRTWARLVQCLQKAGLNTLAKDIEDVLHEDIQDRWFD